MTAKTVTVFTYSGTRHRAECGCSFNGNHTPTVGRAAVEALMHAATTGCQANVPLVFDSRLAMP